MSDTSNRVQAPFRDDHAFWVSVVTSVLALLLALVAITATAITGMAAAVLFSLPAAAIAVAALNARASNARTRPQFASRDEWRHAERRAVAAALSGGFVRHLSRR